MTTPGEYACSCLNEPSGSCLDISGSSDVIVVDPEDETLFANRDAGPPPFDIECSCNTMSETMLAAIFSCIGAGIRNTKTFFDGKFF